MKVILAERIGMGENIVLNVSLFTPWSLAPRILGGLEAFCHYYYLDSLVGCS
jgi:hypothetical protein